MLFTSHLSITEKLYHPDRASLSRLSEPPSWSEWSCPSMTSQRSTSSCLVTWETPCTHTSCKFAESHAHSVPATISFITGEQDLDLNVELMRLRNLWWQRQQTAQSEERVSCLLPVLLFLTPSGPVLCAASPELWPPTLWTSSALAWWTREERLCTRGLWTACYRSEEMTVCVYRFCFHLSDPKKILLFTPPTARQCCTATGQWFLFSLILHSSSNWFPSPTVTSAAFKTTNHQLFLLPNDGAASQSPLPH